MNDEITIDGIVYVKKTGNKKTGNKSTGNKSTGDWSTGDWSTGNKSTGDWSTGNGSTGHLSTGDFSTGNWSTGNRSTGNRSTGNKSTGNWSTGDWSTGDFSTGHWSTGNWSISELSTGHFDTKPRKLRAFNKKVDPDVWNSAFKPSCLFFGLTKWIDDKEMTDAEKSENPRYITTGGYLKVFDYKEAFTNSVKNATKEERDQIRALPNFDDDVFLEVSGCDLRLLDL